MGAASQGNVQVAGKSTSSQLAQASAESKSLLTQMGVSAPQNNTTYNDNKVITAGGGGNEMALYDRLLPFDRNFYNRILDNFAT